MNIGAMSQFGYSIGNYPNNGEAVKNYMADAREKAISADSQVDTFASQIKMEDASFPYSSIAKDGVIEYNGVVFVGDPKTNSINLGDMTDKNHILHIQLSGGGFLNVNYNNIGDLQDAIGMFSGRDQGIILKAISTFHYEQGFVKAAEDEEEETVENIGDKSNAADGKEMFEDVGTESEAEVAMKLMRGIGLTAYDKLVNLHEATIQVGPSKMTYPKWDGEKSTIF